MKLLIASDIHANLEAPQTVLAEPHDELRVLGDLVNYCPNPSGVVDLIRRRATLVLQGNHDYAIGNSTDPQCSRPFREMARAMQEYTESVLNAGQKEFLRNLPRTAERMIDGCRLRFHEVLIAITSGNQAGDWGWHTRRKRAKLLFRATIAEWLPLPSRQRTCRGSRKI